MQKYFLSISLLLNSLCFAEQQAAPEYVDLKTIFTPGQMDGIKIKLTADAYQKLYKTLHDDYDKKYISKKTDKIVGFLLQQLDNKMQTFLASLSKHFVLISNKMNFTQNKLFLTNINAHNPGTEVGAIASDETIRPLVYDSVTNIMAKHFITLPIHIAIQKNLTSPVKLSLNRNGGTLFINDHTHNTFDYFAYYQIEYELLKIKFGHTYYNNLLKRYFSRAPIKTSKDMPLIPQKIENNMDFKNIQIIQEQARDLQIAAPHIQAAQQLEWVKRNMFLEAVEKNQIAELSLNPVTVNGDTRASKTDSYIFAAKVLGYMQAEDKAKAALNQKQ